LAILAATVGFAQQKPQKSDPGSGNAAMGAIGMMQWEQPKHPKTGPKPYKEVITR
jgi:hypothetical protein